MGARIEIIFLLNLASSKAVAPLVGARIEILIFLYNLPTSFLVAPLVGARIEIFYCAKDAIGEPSRSPRGSED